MSFGDSLSAAKALFAMSATDAVATRQHPNIVLIASLRFICDTAIRIRRLLRSVRRKITARILPRLPMIDAVRTHVGRRGDTVRHVEEGGHGGDVTNVAVAKPGAAQGLAIVFLNQPRLGREFHCEIEHGPLALRQPRGAIVHRYQFAERRIAGELAHSSAVSDEAVVTFVM